MLIIRNSIGRYRPADRATFLVDTLVQDAVLMRLQVIGEHLAAIRKNSPIGAVDSQAPRTYYEGAKSTDLAMSQTLR